MQVPRRQRTTGSQLRLITSTSTLYSNPGSTTLLSTHSVATANRGRNNLHAHRLQSALQSRRNVASQQRPRQRNSSSGSSFDGFWSATAVAKSTPRRLVLCLTIALMVLIMLGFVIYDLVLIYLPEKPVNTSIYEISDDLYPGQATPIPSTIIPSEFAVIATPSHMAQNVTPSQMPQNPASQVMERTSEEDRVEFSRPRPTNTSKEDKSKKESHVYIAITVAGLQMALLSATMCLYQGYKSMNSHLFLPFLFCSLPIIVCHVVYVILFKSNEAKLPAYIEIVVTVLIFVVIANLYRVIFRNFHEIKAQHAIGAIQNTTTSQQAMLCTVCETVAPPVILRLQPPPYEKEPPTYDRVLSFAACPAYTDVVIDALNTSGQLPTIVLTVEGEEMGSPPQYVATAEVVTESGETTTAIFTLHPIDTGDNNPQTVPETVSGVPAPTAGYTLQRLTSINETTNSDTTTINVADVLSASMTPTAVYALHLLATTGGEGFTSGLPTPTTMYSLHPLSTALTTITESSTNNTGDDVTFNSGAITPTTLITLHPFASTSQTCTCPVTTASDVTIDVTDSVVVITDEKENKENDDMWIHL